MIKGAQSLFSGVNRPLMPLFEEAYEFLVSDSGCVADVKTIYVGFTLKQEPVASVHPHGGVEFEVALALPLGMVGEFIYEAAHLKWRTLPVAVRVTDHASLTRALPLMREAVRRVESGVHDVEQPDDAFASQRGKRQANTESIS